MGELRQHVEDYLGLRRAVGYKLEGAGRLLGNFAAYAEQAGARAVTIDIAVAWARVPSSLAWPKRGHTAAMRLLQAGVDPSTIALWLGHERAETTQIYVHADQTLKERALARTTPLGATAGRYRPPDTLLAFLEQLR